MSNNQNQANSTPVITGSQYASYTGNFLYDQESQIIQEVNPREYYETDPGTYWAIIVIWWLESHAVTWYQLHPGIKRGLQQNKPVVWEIQQFLDTANKIFDTIAVPTQSGQEITKEEFKWVVWCLCGYSKAGLAANQLAKLTGSTDSEKNFRLLMEQNMVKWIKSQPKQAVEVVAA